MFSCTVRSIFKITRFKNRIRVIPILVLVLGLVLVTGVIMLSYDVIVASDVIVSALSLIVIVFWEVFAIVLRGVDEGKAFGHDGQVLCVEDNASVIEPRLFRVVVCLSLWLPICLERAAHAQFTVPLVTGLVNHGCRAIWHQFPLPDEENPCDVSVIAAVIESVVVTTSGHLHRIT